MPTTTLHLFSLHESNGCTRIKSGPKRCWKHRPGLTTQLDLGERGLAMQATRFVGPSANPVPARRPRIPIVIPDRVAERAGTRWIEDENGCWISTYSVASHGYAQIGWQNGSERRVVLAHRASWVYAHGTQIPDGMTIDHQCKNRRCVNPNHLRLLTNYENARRTHGRDWPIGECANGHPNSMIAVVEGGRYKCRQCVINARNRYYAKKRAS